MSITPDSALVLKGRISDPTSGAAITGCQIDALPLLADGTFGPAIVPASTTTDGYGLYSMNVGAASPTGRYVVKVYDPISHKTRYIFPAISMQVDMLYGVVDSEGEFTAPLPDLSIKTSQYKNASVTDIKLANASVTSSKLNLGSGTYDSGTGIYTPGIPFGADPDTGFSNTLPNQISIITEGLEKQRFTAGGLLLMSDSMGTNLDAALPDLIPAYGGAMQGIALIRNEMSGDLADDPPLKIYGFGNLTTSSPEMAFRASEYSQDNPSGAGAGSYYGRILFQPDTGNPLTRWSTATSIESGSTTNPGAPQYIVLRVGIASLGIDTNRAWTTKPLEVGGSVTVGNNSHLILSGTGQVRAANGTLAIPAISFTSDPNTGIIRSAEGEMTLVSNGSAALVVSPTGVTFAGTLSTSSLALSGSLTVAGTATLSNWAYVGALQVTTSGTFGQVDVTGALTVNGNANLNNLVNATTRILVDGGALATPDIACIADTNTGIVFYGADQMAFVANGQEIARAWKNGTPTQFGIYADQTYIASQLMLGGTQLASSVATVVRAMHIRDGAGATLGWIPIYGAVS